MGGQNSNWARDFFLGTLFGLAIFLLGFGMGGGMPIFSSTPGYLLQAGLLFSVIARKQACGRPAWFFYPTLLLGAVIVIRCFFGGGGSWVGWQDLLVVGGTTSYILAARLGGGRGFLDGVLVMVGLLALGISLTVFLQSTGRLEGHPLGWLDPGQLHRSTGGGAYISGLLTTRTASAAVLNAVALMVVGYALWGKLSVGWRISSFWAAGVMVAAGMLCQSRAGIVGLGFGAGWLACSSLAIVGRYRSRVVWGYVLALGGLGLCSALLLYLFFDGHWGVRSRVLSLTDDPYRLLLWSETISRMNPADFLGGLGPGGYHPWSKSFSGAATSGDPVFLHNDWIQFFLEYGWPSGLVLVGVFLLHIIGAVVLAGRKASTMGATWDWPQSTCLGGKTGAGAALVSLGAHSLFDYAAHVPVTLCMAGMAAGVCAAGGGSGLTGWWRRVLEGLGGLFFLCCTIIIFTRHIGEDFVLWQAEKMVSQGDRTGALSRLVSWRSGEGEAGRQYHIALGDMALQEAKEATVPAERVRLAREAEASYARVLAKDPGDIEGLRGMGISSIFLGNYGVAEALFRKVVAGSPNSPRGYEWLGLCLESQGRDGEAQKAYTIATRRGDAPLARSRLDR